MTMYHPVSLVVPLLLLGPTLQGTSSYKNLAKRHPPPCIHSRLVTRVD